MTAIKKLAVGVDVGGTNTVSGLVDAEGKCHGELSFKTKDYPCFDDYIDRLCQDIEDLKKKVGNVELTGIGIGAPNGNYYNGCAENPVNITWFERDASGKCSKRLSLIPFVEMMKRHYPSIPVVINNDANAAAVGEMIYGGAKGMKDFVEITLGTGLGSGVVAHGELIYGYEGTAGECGHIIIRRNGRECGCGRKGCLETYVSATGIKRTLFELFSESNTPSKLRDLSYQDIESKTIADAALDGDKLALQAFEITGEMLGEALADIAAVTFPEAIFLFGGLAKSGKLIFEPTKRSLEENLLRNYKGKIKLLPSGIDGANAAILGASALVWQELKKQLAATK